MDALRAICCLAGMPLEDYTPSSPSTKNFRHFQNLNKRPWLYATIKYAEARLQRQVIPLTRKLAYKLLLECTNIQELELVWWLNSLVAQSGLESVAGVVDHVIRAFALCQMLVEALKSFSKVSEPSDYTWSAVFSAYVKPSLGELVFALYDRIQPQGLKPGRLTFQSILQTCITAVAIEQGRRIHEQIIGNGLQSDVVVSSNLITLYAKCGSLYEAQKVFDRSLNKNTVSWCALLSAYVQHGKAHLVLGCFDMMVQDGMQLTKVIFLIILKACKITGRIQHGRCTHEKIITSSLQYDVMIGTTLVDMYIKCGSLDEACYAFGMLSEQSIVSWNAMIAGYAQHGEGWLALECLENLLHSMLKPDRYTFSSILKACGSVGAIQQGRRIHVQIVENNLHDDVVIGTTLIDMYVKCGSLDEANKFFIRLLNRNVFTWNAMVTGYCLHNECMLALSCYNNMQDEGIKPDEFTFSGVLKACGCVGAIQHGRFTHAQIIAREFQHAIVVRSALVDMYVKCEGLEEAYEVFEVFRGQDIVAYNAMITGYAQDNGLLALNLFDSMHHEGINPDEFTFSSILKACSSIKALEQGRCIHELVIDKGFESNITIGSTLVDMYSNCGSLKEACQVFESLPKRNVVAWNVMISGYAQHGSGHLALECYEQMHHEQFAPDRLTYSSIIKACASIGAINLGRQIHESIVESGFQYDVAVGNMLVDMYAQCGSLDEAHYLFNKLPNLMTMAWNALIVGYNQVGRGDLAMECFENMKHDGAAPSKLTYVNILRTCGNSKTIETGRRIHEHVIDYGFQDIIGSTLIDMYCNYGNLEEACNVFRSLLNQDIMSWSAMIVGYAQLGKARLAINLFEDMLCTGIRPDGISFGSVLTACSHGGFVDEALWYYHLKDNHCIQPNTFHIMCMVDVLGTAGCFSEASTYLKMSKLFDTCIWMALLNSCNIHRNFKLGSFCFDQIIALNPLCAPAYALMSNMCAGAQMVGESAQNFGQGRSK